MVNTSLADVYCSWELNKNKRTHRNSCSMRAYAKLLSEQGNAAWWLIGIYARSGWPARLCGSNTTPLHIFMGWTVWGSNPGEGEIIRTCPYRPWGLPNLLYNGYRVFPRGKAAGAWCWPPTPSRVDVKENVELYICSPSGPSRPVLGRALPLPLLYMHTYIYIHTHACMHVYKYIYIYTYKYPRYRPTWPRGVQEVKSPRFLDTRRMKVVRSSPLRTGRLYPQEYPGTHF